MKDLETRYRSLLRLLPLPYREKWADDMVSTFLDSTLPDDPEDAEELAQFGRPDRTEVFSVVALAVRLRFAGSAGPARYATWGAAVRLVALTGLLFNAVAGLVDLELLFWADGRIPWLAAPPVQEFGGPVRAAWVVSGLLWTIAFLLLLNGNRREARFFAGLGLVRGAVAPALAVFDSITTDVPVFLFSQFLELGVNVVVVGLLWAFHEDAGPVRPRGWLIALVAAVVLNPLPPVIATRVGTSVPLDWTGFCCAGFVVATAVYLAVSSWRTPARSLALGLVAAGLVTLRVAILLDLATVRGVFVDAESLYPVVGVEAALVLVMGALAALRARREVRPLSVS